MEPQTERGAVDTAPVSASDYSQYALQVAMGAGGNTEEEETAAAAEQVQVRNLPQVPGVQDFVIIQASL